MQKHFLGALLCLFSSFHCFAQEDELQKLPCDALAGKPLDSLFEKAEDVFYGKIMRVVPFGAETKYQVSSLFKFKGDHAGISFTQLDNKRFFEFKEDSTYIFFVFPNYEDKIFSTCFMFGKKDNMKRFLGFAKTKCHELPPLPPEKAGMIQTGACPRNVYDPICGCDGKDYSSPCEALQNGKISMWAHGRCKDVLPDVRDLLR